MWSWIEIIAELVKMLALRLADEAALVEQESAWNSTVDGRLVVVMMTIVLETFELLSQPFVITAEVAHDELLEHVEKCARLMVIGTERHKLLLAILNRDQVGTAVECCQWCSLDLNNVRHNQGESQVGK